MTIEDLITEARKRCGIKPYIHNQRLVKNWWPKPKIRYAGEIWGFECYSPSMLGFHPRDAEFSKTITAECKAYGETPEAAYDKWCSIFGSWNKKEDWV